MHGFKVLRDKDNQQGCYKNLHKPVPAQQASSADNTHSRSIYYNSIHTNPTNITTKSQLSVMLTERVSMKLVPFLSSVVH